MTKKIPVSRRARPAKPPLSKTWIVDVALHLLRTEGLEHVTMRRVAQALDTGPASLYVYIRDTVDLHAELLDRVLADLRVPVDGRWEQRLTLYLLDYGDLLFLHPGLARSALTSRPSGPHYLHLHDSAMGLLMQGGVAPGPAAWGADLLVLLVTATAAEHAAAAPSPASDTSAQDADDQLHFEVLLSNPEHYPHLSAYADLALAGTPGERRGWQLQATIAGIAKTALPFTLLQTPTQEEDHD